MGRLLSILQRLTGRTRDNVPLDSFDVDAEEVREHFGSNPDELAAAFLSHDGRAVDKWLHYIPLYDRYLKRYQGTDVKWLEIGVDQGGSLELFREFFGPDAILYGVDIEPTCAHFATPPNEIRIGSQDDQSFLRAVVNEMGGVDVVLDDGSHVGRHQQASFETLFPILPDDGLYIIEDTHTSYWTYWEGGYRKSGTAIEYCKALVDDMHHWYHNRPLSTPLAKEIGGIFFHDSLIVIEKAQARRPMKAKMGTSTKRE